MEKSGKSPERRSGALMVDDLVIRPGTAGDASNAAELILSTLHEFGDRLFGFGDHARAVEALSQFFRMQGNRFSFQYAAIGASSNDVAGIMMAFTQGQMRRAMAINALQMVRVYRLHEMPQFLMNAIPYRSEEKIYQDELYIAHLAVSDSHRRKGIGFRLLDHACQAATILGKRKLSLITEVENEPARTLYEKFGFSVKETILPPPAMRSESSEGDVRMVMQIN